MLAPEFIAALLVTGDSAAIGAELDCLCEHGMTIAERETHLAEKAAETERLKLAAAEAEKLKAEDEKRKAVDAAAAEAERVLAAQKAEEDAEEQRKAAELLTGRAAQLSEASTGENETSGTDTSQESHEPEREEGTNNQPAADPASYEAQDDPYTSHESHPSHEPESDAAAEDEEEDEDDTRAPLVIDGRRNEPPPAPPAPTLTDITGRLNDALTDAMNLGPDDMLALLNYLRCATNDIAAVLDTMKQAA